MYQSAFFWNGTKLIFTINMNLHPGQHVEDVMKVRFWNYVNAGGEHVKLDDLPDAHSHARLADGHVWHINLED